jgi:putative transposase
LAEASGDADAAKRGCGWYSDETYIKVHGQWRELYRAIDCYGALDDVMFSEHRDMATLISFFESAKMIAALAPNRAATDGHESYPRAIRAVRVCGIGSASISITNWSQIIARQSPLRSDARVQEYECGR